MLKVEFGMHSKDLSGCLGMIVPLVLAALSVTGCSTVGPPKDRIAAAELAVEQANKSKAPQYSPLELRMARDKLAEAKQAMNKKEYTVARRLAEEALVDAEAAGAKAASEDAKRAVSDLRESLETLRREAERSSRGG